MAYAPRYFLGDHWTAALAPARGLIDALRILGNRKFWLRTQQVQVMLRGRAADGFAAASKRQEGNNERVPAGCPQRSRCLCVLFQSPRRLSGAPASTPASSACWQDFSPHVGGPCASPGSCRWVRKLQHACSSAMCRPGKWKPSRHISQPCSGCCCPAGPSPENKTDIADLEATENAVPAASLVAGSPAAAAAAADNTQSHDSPGAPPTSAPDDRAGRPAASSGGSSTSSSKAAGSQATELEDEEQGGAVTGTGYISSSVRARGCAPPTWLGRTTRPAGPWVRRTPLFVTLAHLPMPSVS